MKKYNIYAGLGGSFGGAYFIETLDCANEDEAVQIAYEAAVELYEQYEGLHGLPDFNDCLEEAADLPDISNMTIEESAEELYNAYKEDWLEYYAVLTEEDDEEEEVEGDDDGNEIEEF